MRFSLMFPLMLVLLGGATLLIGNVPALDRTVATPVSVPGEGQAGDGAPSLRSANQDAAEEPATPEPAAEQPAAVVRDTGEPVVVESKADPPVEAPSEVPAHASAVPPATPAPPNTAMQAEAAAPPLFFMPVDGVVVAEVAESFGDPRGTDRLHEGIDIMAERGTPVRAAAPGTVRRVTESARGGLSVTIIGADGLRYFYTHFDSFPEDLAVDQEVGVDTVIGFVGNSGNAAATAPHLHFGVYRPGDDGPWSWEAFDPLPFLIDRSPATAE